MSLHHLLSRVLLILVPLAITSTTYLYLYPVFNGCAHPLPVDDADQGSQRSAFLNAFREHFDPESAQEPATVRLLVLADPQLEGDTSLPLPEYEFGFRVRKHWNDTVGSLRNASFPLHLDVVRRTASTALYEFLTGDIPRALSAIRKRVDLLGNDFYLAHIYRTLHWWTRPTHVTVLGDLLGSQWVTDEEFDRRGQRYWERVFPGGERISDETTATGAVGYDAAANSWKTTTPADDLEELRRFNSSWTNRIINVVGNHDIGYAGDASHARIQRFERVFGRVNWDVRFRHPPPANASTAVYTGAVPTLHVINLNSLTLDGPPFDPDIQAQSYQYINDVISHRSYPVEDRMSFTLLLTHVPLYKRDGVCTDGPYFTFFEEETEETEEKEEGEDKDREEKEEEEEEEETPQFKVGGLREQNHLSEHASSNGILQGIYGMSGDEHAPAGGWGRRGLILTGHDHTGCDVVHYVDRSKENDTDEEEEEDSSSSSKEEKEKENTPGWVWNARRYNAAASESRQPASTPSIREITLRSMMGEYGGNAGLLSLWFDYEAVQWKYAMSLCPAGVQHIWWAVHIVDLVAVVGLGVYIAALGFGQTTPPATVIGVEKEKKTQ
ncbi:hypothetical protein ARAM_006228 [Aspergillus rambellii]|uniref:Calcineurin-like phosphoesterase domain-containing protein n=1 Tax=Aspergillus rambellii TaxID=308745 RepID=A0A0F8V4I5_9EURO|nr:hypothetical protein ARAM_006228 [Aspergillus rambellii]